MYVFHFIKQRTTKCLLSQVYSNPLSTVLSTHLKSDCCSLKFVMSVTRKRHLNKGSRSFYLGPHAGCKQAAWPANRSASHRGTALQQGGTGESRHRRAAGRPWHHHGAPRSRGRCSWRRDMMLCRHIRRCTWARRVCGYGYIPTGLYFSHYLLLISVEIKRIATAFFTQKCSCHTTMVSEIMLQGYYLAIKFSSSARS